MENNSKIKYFLGVTILVAILSFIFLFPANRTYRGEIQILLISRNQVVDEKIDSITENAKNIPTTLSFYDRVIKSNSLSDPSKDLSSQERKSYWNSIMKSQRVNGSNIVKITAYNKDEKQAEKLAAMYARELSETLARYYNIKYQVDSRIIDEPITYLDWKKSIVPTAAKSLFWGVLAGILDIILITIIPAAQIKKKYFIPKNIFARKNNLPEYTEPDYFPIKPVEPEKKDKVKKTAPTAIKEKIITPEKKASAPENLPFADEETTRLFQKKMYAGDLSKNEIEEKEDNPEEKKEESPKEKDIFREATPEEVKERLNKLLSGKL